MRYISSAVWSTIAAWIHTVVQSKIWTIFESLNLKKGWFFFYFLTNCMIIIEYIVTEMKIGTLSVNPRIILEWSNIIHYEILVVFYDDHF